MADGVVVATGPTPPSSFSRAIESAGQGFGTGFQQGLTGRQRLEFLQPFLGPSGAAPESFRAAQEAGIGGAAARGPMFQKLFQALTRNPALLADDTFFSTITSLAQPQQPESFTLSPGERRFRGSELVAEVPAEQEPVRFTRVVSGDGDLNRRFNLGIPKGESARVEFTRDPASGTVTSAAVQGRFATEGPVQTLSENEVRELGLPEGSVVQRKGSGALNIVFKPPESDRVRDQKISQLAPRFEQMGLPNARQLATDVVDGNVDVEVLESGQVRLVDKVKAASGQPGAVTELPVSPGAGVAPRAEIPREETLFSLSEDATGIRSQVLSVTGRVPGTQVTQSERQVLQARSAFNLVQNDLARSLVNNERFPVREREAVLDAFDIKPAVFDTPSATRVRLQAMDRFLRTRVAQFERDVADPNLSEDVRSAQRANASAMRNAIDRMGVPQAGFFEGVRTSADVEQLSRADVQLIVNQASEAELDALPEDVQQALARKLR